MHGEGIRPTSERVEEYTPREVNERIERQIAANVAYYTRRLEDIEYRLEELDQEWDVERTLETTASTITLAGLVLGLFSKRMLVLPFVVAGFLLQHALKGWCPPIPLIRRMGIRTNREINKERYALKALRGDFEDVKADTEDALEAAERALQAAELGGLGEHGGGERSAGGSPGQGSTPAGGMGLGGTPGLGNSGPGSTGLGGGTGAPGPGPGPSGPSDEPHAW